MIVRREHRGSRNLIEGVVTHFLHSDSSILTPALECEAPYRVLIWVA